MGTLKTTIELNDKFSKQLDKINRSIQNTANAMNGLNRTSLNGVNRTNKALSQQISQNNTIMKQLGSWVTKIRNIATIYFGIRNTIQGINKAVMLSDRMTMTDAKYNLVAGGNKKLAGDLKEKTFYAAQRSTTDYLEFGKAVGKLGVLAGDKFKNQDSIVRFVELMNKSFQISGADTSERNAAMLQITQAIASNRLQGDEFRSILENAPMVMQALTKSLNIGHDKLKAMAKEGKITADVLIKAMFDAGKQIEDMYKQLPMTWERHWAKLKNVGILAFEPIHQQLEKLFGSEKFQSVMNGIGTALIVIGNLVGKALGTLFNSLNNIVSLFERFPLLLTTLQVLLGGLGVAFGAFFTAQLIGIGKSIIAWILARKEAFLYQLALFKMAVAQHGLNAAIAMCPLTWLVYAIIAVITVVYLAVAAVNHFAGTSISATGLIVGVITTAVTFIWNIIYGLLSAILQLYTHFANGIIGIIEFVINCWSGGFDNFGEGVKNLIGQIISWFLQLGKVVTTIVDAIFGTNWTEGLNSLSDKLQSWGKNEKAITLKRFDSKEVLGSIGVKRGGYSNAWDTGYKWGSNIENSIGKLTKVTLNGQQLTADALNGINGTLGDIGGSGADTAKNTGDIAKNTSELDYSYLRDWSYLAGMGGSIGYEIKIEQNNRNNIASHLDVKKITKLLIDEFVNGINAQAEGVR